jgi:hypothetical protein
VDGVEYETDCRMVGAAHHVPGVAIVMDVAPPGERLEGNSDGEFSGGIAVRC